MRKVLISFVAVILFYVQSYGQEQKREIISLNGEWSIGEGKMNKVPSKFDHSIQVPGLVTFATPAFKDAAPKAKKRDPKGEETKDTLREAYWYKRTFFIKSQIPSVAVLHVAKAMFGTKVILNGNDLGEHLPSFTSGYFDVKKALRKGKNEILIRVGASRTALPKSMPDGWDYEKQRYIAGIYDNVELVLSGAPNIVSVQTVPDIYLNRVKVQVKLSNIGNAKTSKLKFIVAEAKSGKAVSSVIKDIQLSPDSSMFYAEVPVPDARLWSPEDPFLYKMTVSTPFDEYSCRFGMREFYLDTIRKCPMLNGKPYYLRGSNITLLRFVEDDAYSRLAFDTTWVRNLHKSFKKFHWNSLRYCIGLPPQEWYNIADEEGILIQDEFPIWYGGKSWSTWPEELKADELEKEYSEWMQDNWNHPCVVIWDASNETYCKNEEIAKAVEKVRSLDLSNRPFDNSYSTQRARGDVYESHPYHFQNPKYQLRYLSKADVNPGRNPAPNVFNNPVIINEYGWLWLNRDGSPTTLTKNLYHNLLGDSSTVEQRRHLYATYLAAETEFWRCHRKAAGVLHFTALGYSRKNGETSDHFINPATLEYEPEFEKYIADAFSPVGIMLDEWGDTLSVGKTHEFRMITINDLEKDWRGRVKLRIIDKNKIVSENSADLYLPAYGSVSLTILCETPSVKGIYAVEAVLESDNQQPVRSYREIPFN